MENNLDFRLLTTANVYGTQIAAKGDIAVIAKKGNTKYSIYFVNKTNKKKVARN